MLDLNSLTNFTWCWSYYWFLEPQGSQENYIWSDPTYGGDNTIKKYRGSFFDFMFFIYHNRTGVGRDKGIHRIKNFCGDRVKIN